jgi:hypothetical protein
VHVAPGQTERVVIALAPPVQGFRASIDRVQNNPVRRSTRRDASGPRRERVDVTAWVLAGSGIAGLATSGAMFALRAIELARCDTTYFCPDQGTVDRFNGFTTGAVIGAGVAVVALSALLIHWALAPRRPRAATLAGSPARRSLAAPRHGVDRGTLFEGVEF